VGEILKDIKGATSREELKQAVDKIEEIADESDWEDFVAEV